MPESDPRETTEHLGIDITTETMHLLAAAGYVQGGNETG
jgi:hypothetical protein